jgi:hypothetical protein
VIKIPRRNKNERNFGYLSVILVLVIGFGGTFAGLYFTGLMPLSAVTNEGDTTTEGDTEYYSTYFTSAIPFTEIFFVDSDGDDDGGESWEHAFTTIQNAITEASSELHDITLLVLAPEIFDINTGGTYTVSKNIGIIGLTRQSTTIINSHVSATCVMKFTGLVYLSYLQFDIGSSSKDGIVLDGVVGSELNYLYVECANANGAQDGIEFNDCEFIDVTGVRIHGNVAYTTAIYITGDSYLLRFNDCALHTSLIGVKGDVDVRSLYFLELITHICSLGIDINDDAQNVYFVRATFLSNDDNIDNSHNVLFMDPILTHTEYQVLPNGTSDGISIVGGVASDTYGSWTEIIFSVNISEHFIVAGVYVSNPSATADMYGIQLSYGNSNTVITTAFFDAGDKFGTPVVSGIESGVLPANTNVSARIQTSSGGSDTVDAWIQYIVI